jgi:hypothetical protein
MVLCVRCKINEGGEDIIAARAGITEHGDLVGVIAASIADRVGRWR